MEYPMEYPTTIEEFETLVFKQQEKISYFQEAYYKEAGLREKSHKSNINSIDRLNDLLRKKNNDIDKLQDKIEALEARLEHLQVKPKPRQEHPLERKCFYEEELKERLEYSQDKPKPEPKAPPLGVGKEFKTRKEPLPPPPLGVGKMKKSIGKNKPYPSREPRYHMTEVARDWAS